MDEKFKTAYAALAKDPTQRDALAALIVEYIDPNHIAADIVGLMLNTRALKPGDALVKKVRRGIDVRTLVPGSIHLASEITLEDRVNWMLDGADIKVRANEWELESGELGTVASIRSEMLATLKDYFAGRAFTCLANIWNAANTPNNYVAVAALTAPTLQTALDYMRYAVGNVRAVVGTRLGLGPITQFANFDPTGVWGNADAIKEIYQTGWLGQWYGAPIVALDQVFNNPVQNQIMVPNRYVLVIADNAGEFITYGEPKWKQWTEMQPTPPDWFLEVYQQFGLIVDNAQGIYVIDVTTLA